MHVCSLEYRISPFLPQIQLVLSKKKKKILKLVLTMILQASACRGHPFTESIPFPIYNSSNLETRIKHYLHTSLQLSFISLEENPSFHKISHGYLQIKQFTHFSKSKLGGGGFVFYYYY